LVSSSLIDFELDMDRSGGACRLVDDRGGGELVASWCRSWWAECFMSVEWGLWLKVGESGRPLRRCRSFWSQAFLP
jgi:hypothetical protein